VAALNAEEPSWTPIDRVGESRGSVDGLSVVVVTRRLGCVGSRRSSAYAVDG
jgi:hypothetical protein